MNKTDLQIGSVLGLLGFFLGIAVLWQSGELRFYQNFTPEVVYFACGHGFRHPGEIPPKLIAFLIRETTMFNCADIGAAPVLNPPGLFAILQLYQSLAVAMIWRVTSISYINLWPLVGLASGLYAAGCFALLRQFFGRWPAGLGAAFLMVSPVCLPILVFFRDYSKAPFFVWAIVFLVLAMRTKELKPMLGWACASGLAIGVGCGFRGDLIIMLPLGVIVLLVAFDLRQLFLRMAAVFAFSVSVITSAWPILSVESSGTWGSVIIQGMADPFRNYIKMIPAPYSFGARYSDELVLSSVAADERPLRPDWDSREGVAVYGVSQANSLSGENWLEFFPYFLGDFVAQAFKSASWIVGYPALVAAGKLPDPGLAVMKGPPISVFMAPVYSLVAQKWMPWLGLLGLYVFFARILTRSVQEAVALGLLFAALVTYPVVQFSVRHVFHLEFIWVCAMLALLSVPSAIDAVRKAGWRFALAVSASALVVVGTYLALVQRQQTMLTREFDKLLQSPRELVHQSPASPAPQTLAMAVPVPSRHQAIVRSLPDSMTPAIRWTGIQWKVISAADRLLLTFSGKGCRNETSIAVNYTKTADVWQKFDQTMIVKFKRNGDGTQVLIPAFYRATQHFSSLNVDKLPANCGARLERITGDSIFPALLSAILSPDWRERPLHAGLGGF